MRWFISSLSTSFVLIGSRAALACPLCTISGQAKTRAAYLGATLFMILAVATLLTLVGFAIYRLTKDATR